MTNEPLWQRQRRLGKESPNPFKRKRSRNQRVRYLNKRESAEHPAKHDQGGNRKY